MKNLNQAIAAMYVKMQMSNTIDYEDIQLCKDIILNEKIDYLNAELYSADKSGKIILMILSKLLDLVNENAGNHPRLWFEIIGMLSALEVLRERLSGDSSKEVEDLTAKESPETSGFGDTKFTTTIDEDRSRLFGDFIRQLNIETVSDEASIVCKDCIDSYVAGMSVDEKYDKPVFKRILNYATLLLNYILEEGVCYADPLAVPVYPGNSKLESNMMETLIYACEEGDIVNWAIGLEKVLGKRAGDRQELVSGISQRVGRVIDTAVVEDILDDMEDELDSSMDIANAIKAACKTLEDIDELRGVTTVREKEYIKDMINKVHGVNKDESINEHTVQPSETKYTTCSISIIDNKDKETSFNALVSTEPFVARGYKIKHKATGELAYQLRLYKTNTGAVIVAKDVPGYDHDPVEYFLVRYEDFTNYIKPNLKNGVMNVGSDSFTMIIERDTVNSFLKHD